MVGHCWAAKTVLNDGRGSKGQWGSGMGVAVSERAWGVGNEC